MVKKFNNTLEDALVGFWHNYIGWGRATRAEYWWAALFYGLICSTLAEAFGLANWWLYVTLVPSFCLFARRLHDTGRSNWNMCWHLLPIIGQIILLVFMCQKGSTTKNKYGPARLKK